MPRIKISTRKLARAIGELSPQEMAQVLNYLGRWHRPDRLLSNDEIPLLTQGISNHIDDDGRYMIGIFAAAAGQPWTDIKS